MFLISLSVPRTGWFRGWVQDGEHYRPFVHMGKEFKLLDPKVPVDKYESYDHFINVMGKFAPEVEFFLEKEYVSSLSLRTLTRIAQERGIGLDTY